MAFVKMVDPAEATGRLGKIYEAAVQRAGKVFNILRVQSQNPAALEAGLGLYRTIMFGSSPLTRAEREMLAVVVSRVNGCDY